MKCGGWDLIEPEHGSVKCFFDGPFAQAEDACELVCNHDYSAEVNMFYCMANGGWHPTKNPTCTKDGSMTIIIVPVVVGSIFILILLGVIYARTSTRCRSKRRAHDDETECGNNFGPPEPLGNIYMMKTMQQRPGIILKKEDENNSEKLNNVVQDEAKEGSKKTEKVKFMSRPRRMLKFRKNLAKRWQKSNNRTRALFQRGFKRVPQPWKLNRLREIYRNRVTDVKMSNPADHSPTPSLSSSCSCCEIESSCSCSIFEKDVPTKQLPPPRPPSLKVKTPLKVRKRSPRKSRKHCHEVEKRASSGYSSEEKERTPKRYPPKHRKNKRESDREGSKAHVSKQYPIATTERDLHDTEHDYRKRGFVTNGEIYHPCRHNIKTYPIKPAHKEAKKKEIKIIVEKELEVKAPLGGVKYYPIKPDKNEIKDLKRKTKKSRRKSNKNSTRNRTRDQRENKIQKKPLRVTNQSKNIARRRS